MKCPFCRRKLFLGKWRNFETLIEYCFTPNATDYPLRQTYECVCMASYDGFWDVDGLFYRDKGFSEKFAKRFANSPFSALGSWQKKYENSCKFERFLQNWLGLSRKKSYMISSLFFRK